MLRAPSSPVELTLSLLAIVAAAWSSAATAADSPARGSAPFVAPFVAGFERFVRPGDLDPVSGGRLLLGELGCTACHASQRRDVALKLGPRLDGAGLRLQREWLRRYLADPAAAKPGTTMPDVLHALPAAKKTQAIAALVAFLGTLREPFPPVVSTGSFPVAVRFWAKGQAKRGAVLYHQVGCVACHQPVADYPATPQPPSELEKLLAQLTPEEIKELGLDTATRPFGSVPHGDLLAKYTREGLTHFLLNPEPVRPAGRMPAFKLDPAESADLAAYLQRAPLAARPESSPPLRPPKTLVAAGRRLFVELQCVRCHTAGKLKPVGAVGPLEKLDTNASNSCLARTPGPNRPRYRLDKIQAAALQAALAPRKPVRRRSPATLAAAELDDHLLRYNCLACHERLKRGGIGPRRRRYFETAGHVDLGDEGRLPPALDGVGGKLTVKWLTRVLAGTGDVRGYLQARMPVFPVSAVAGLPRLLSQADRPRRPIARAVFGKTAGLADAGRKMVDTGCVQCHPVRGERLPGVAGIDLAGTTERLHPDWLRAFLLDPASLKTRTRMPTFFPKGKTNRPDLLDGNVDRQLAAVWSYLSDISRQPLPEKIIRGRVDNYELVPRDRPVLLRTYMRTVGLHAIAVGFPQKVHLAFDTRGGRVVQAWRGRFLDAHATWFNRFIPPASPLGTEIVNLPPGISVARLDDNNSPWPTAEKAGYRFGGYRLDRRGVPTFLYSFGTLSVEDRFEPGPAPAKSLRRFLKLRVGAVKPPPQSKLWFRALQGKTLKSDQGSFTNDAGLTVQISKPTTGSLVRRSGDRSEWLIPVGKSATTTIEVHYRW